MKEFNVLLTSINDVKLFVNKACEQTFDIDIVSGRYIIDAKSIMGLFSIDLTKPIKVEIHGDETEAEAFREQIQSLIAQ